MDSIDPLTSPGPTYVRAATAIRAAIASGEIAGRLPAERSLAAELGIAYMTLRRAVELLRDEGVLITRQGWGTFVADAHR